MSKLNSLYIFLLLSITISKCGGIMDSETGKTQRKQQKIVRKLDDSTTNPANFPTSTPSPTIITVPASPNPTTPANNQFPTTPPATTTVPASTTPTTPTSTPITNPANPGNVPVSNPPTQPTPTQPTGGSPASGQGDWCVANSGASETALQSALDYACGNGADCSTIQDGGSCYNPNSLANHASYAFNSYFQNNPSPTSCDFGGAAQLVNTNPSTGSCIYPSSGSGGGAGGGTGTGTATPLSTTTPATETPSSSFPTPTTTSSPGTNGFGSPSYGSFGSPPSFSSPGSPNSLFPATYGPDSPPLGSLPAGSAALRPDISFITLVVFYFTGKLVLST